MRYSVTHLIMRHMLGYTHGQQLDHQCNLMTFVVSSVLTNVWRLGTLHLIVSVIWYLMSLW